MLMPMLIESGNAVADDDAQDDASILGCFSRPTWKLLAQVSNGAKLPGGKQPSHIVGMKTFYLKTTSWESYRKNWINILIFQETLVSWTFSGKFGLLSPRKMLRWCQMQTNKLRQISKPRSWHSWIPISGEIGRKKTSVCHGPKTLTPYKMEDQEYLLSRQQGYKLHIIYYNA